MASRVRTLGPHPLIGASVFYGKLSRTSGSLVTYSRSSGVSSKKAHYEYMSDVVTPGYNRTVREGGLLPMNPMTKLSEFGQTTPGDIVVKVVGKTNPSNSYTMTYTGMFAEHNAEYIYSSFRPSISVNTGPLIQEAQARLNTAGWDAGTSASEFGKVIQLVVGAKRRIISLVERLLKDLRKKYRNGFPFHKWEAELGQLWLEARYGWRPLIYDMISIADALQTLKEFNSSKLSRYTTFGTAEQTREFQVSQSTIYSDGFASGSSWSFNGIGSVHRLIEVRCGVAARTSFQDVAFADPLVTAWELIPFSFVIDWFANIDDILAAWSPVVRRSTVHAFVTTLDQTTLSYSVSAPTNLNETSSYRFEVEKNTPSTLSYSFVSKKREPVSVPFDLTVRLPSPNIGNLIDLRFLIAGMVKKSGLIRI